MENIKEDFELRNLQFKDAVASCKDIEPHGDSSYHQAHRHKMTDEKKRRRRRRKQA